MIGRRHPKILKPDGRIQHVQFAQGNRCEAAESCWIFPLEGIFNVDDVAKTRGPWCDGLSVAEMMGGAF